MPNPQIKRIQSITGTTYDIVDAGARELIAALEGSTSFLGVTTTPLTDGATTNPIVVNGANVDAVTGGIASYGSKEFIWNGSAWQEFGDLSSLGALAYKNNATTTYTPAGSVSQPTFTGTEGTVSVKGTPSGSVTITTADNTNGNYQPKGTISQPSFTGSSSTFTGNFTPAGNVTISKASSGTANYTPAGSVTSTFTGDSITSTGKYTPAGSVSFTNGNKTATVSKANSGEATYTPEGSVSAPTISVGTAGSTATVNSITNVGTLPEMTMTVENETLTFGFSQGTLPTKGANQTVKTSDATYTASAPTFTGTGARLVTGNISVPTSASFSGTEGDVSVSGTTTGSVSSSFTGTGARLEGSFSGTQGSVSVSGTPEGTVSQPTFTGTKAQINGSFSGTETTSTGDFTPEGTVSKPTFTGTQATITVS
jgi:hypothetical protein